MEHSIMKSLLRTLLKLTMIALVLSLFSQPVLANSALVIRGNSANFEQVLLGMTDDLEDEVSISELVINKTMTAKDIDAAIKRSRPDLIIVMGNKAVNLYVDYQAENPDKAFPPSIALAALFIDKFAQNMKNATAIRYEVPAVTSAVVMRDVFGKPIKKLGVVYREWMEDLIEENRRYCEAEGIELVGIKLPNKSGSMTIKVKKALKKLNEKVDALWILNDNALLTREALVKAWLPIRSKSKIPAIVGLKQFMTNIPIGSFAIVPDHYGLGAQAAGMIFYIMDNDWQLENTEIQQPVSTLKLINTKILKGKKIKYIEEKLDHIDEVIR